MDKHYDVTKIDWNALRHQKLELLKAITKRDKPEEDEELMGIVHLIDSIQDFVVDELGYNPNEVYLLEEPDPDFPEDPLSKLVVTEEAKAIVKDIMTKAIYATPVKPIISTWLCQHCHSNNVELKYWVNPNNNAVGTDCEEEIGYCNDCDLHSELYTADLKADAKVVGFQVVSDDDEGNIHPDMAGSFCIYNLEQAKGMIEKGCNNPEQQWRLLTIWDGDVEEPTMMFEGDPRA